jgi:hypothetical protein
MSFSRIGALSGLAVLAAATTAHAAYQTVDLTTYVNQGFNNGGWFINGGDFTSLIGTTTGNQGSAVPFLVTDTVDVHNNFWFGLDDGTGTDSLFGPPGSLTIPVSATNVSTVYVLADNTFGREGANEFDVVLNGTGGSLTYHYIGGANTKDYNWNCNTTGCDVTPGAGYWFVNGDGVGDDPGNQWLQVTGLAAPAGLTSITFNQIDGTDGLILAGVTLGVPEPAAWTLMIAGFGLAGASLRARGRKAA